MKKTFVIVTAAGEGKRFKALSKQNTPKQYLNLAGAPVILYSLAAFQKCRAAGEIIVSASRRDFDFIHKLAVKNKITKLAKLAEGGRTRFHSVKNAFLQIEGASGNDLVLIHDAARPNISAGLVNKILAQAYKDGEVIIGNQISETVKRSKEGYAAETLKREDLWTVQTPQVFRYKVLESAYKKCGRKNDFTDESSLVEYAGYRVKVIEGPKDNIKITSPYDLARLKKIIL
jgi:2-C-methyl-D-erythritol 4-phosphate cytidylyltransferase